MPGMLNKKMEGTVFLLVIQYKTSFLLMQYIHNNMKMVLGEIPLVQLLIFINNVGPQSNMSAVWCRVSLQADIYI
jgi:hypothetical protein